MPTKTISITVTQHDYDQLSDVKASRTWEQAILEEFDVVEP